MDFSNYWQENKRFLMSVGVGAVAFFSGWFAIDAYIGADLRAAKSKKARVEADLRSPMYAPADLERVTAENAALQKACDELRTNLEFAVRPDFRMEKGVAATSRYFAVLERTREDLRRRAGRAGLAIPSDLGMPAVAPTKEAELARYLEALDAVEQVTGLAIGAGATRLEQIRVKLDPRLLSGKAFSDVERTLVEFRFAGPALPLTQLLAELRNPRHGRVLAVDRVDIAPARSKASDDVRMDLTLLLPHLNSVGVAASPEAAQ